MTVWTSLSFLLVKFRIVWHLYGILNFIYSRDTCPMWYLMNNMFTERKKNVTNRGSFTLAIDTFHLVQHIMLSCSSLWDFGFTFDGIFFKNNNNGHAENQCQHDVVQRKKWMETMERTEIERGRQKEKDKVTPHLSFVLIVHFSCLDWATWKIRINNECNGAVLKLVNRWRALKKNKMFFFFFILWSERRWSDLPYSNAIKTLTNIPNRISNKQNRLMKKKIKCDHFLPHQMHIAHIWLNRVFEH